MSMNRAQRRTMKGGAADVAAKLASCGYDLQGSAIMPVTDRWAIAALTRAFTFLLRFGGEPVAAPNSDTDEPAGFARWAADRAPCGVTWLAVGMDAENRASYSLQSASSPVRGHAHEAARMLALSRLAGVCATARFPMGAARGRT